mmetsp:Transcript_10674/g.25327  ORF Transcript_10674/g.25327 Transcript_10674/m.25327 type:complete len:493 (-) Transcript_10674:553-2031(-)
MWFQYVWIVACGALLALFVAYGIGANDVANAFATSVGGKSLTIRQALLVAAVCEFSGAVLLGSKVTSTVRKGIADYHAFLEAPELLMYGMLCVLLATGLWLVISCYFELPVSTTHSVIGGIIGMAVTAEGWKAVNWYQSSSRFPYVEGVVAIVISWIVSPVLSGLLSTALFGSVRYLVLRAENSYDRSWYVLPLLVFVTVLVNVFFIIFKGASGRLSLSLATSVWVSFLVGAVATLVVGAVIIPLLKRKVRHNLPDSTAGGEEHVEHQDEPQELKGQAVEIELPTEGQQNTTPTVLLTSESKGSSAWSRITSSLGQGVNYNVHGPVETDKTVHDIHDLSERFDPKTEQSFKYLQVFTAICDSFSHGANDVANSVGPFAAIWGIYINDGIKAEAQVPVWILALGGVGIVIGLATYGYKIMCAIGVKMCRITASRGFAIELGAAIVIVVGSQLGIPLSTTHCQVPTSRVQASNAKQPVFSAHIETKRCSDCRLS